MEAELRAEEQRRREVDDVSYIGYADYLRSAHWLTIRKRIGDKAGWLCPCGAPATQVHHVTYARIGYERDSDLRALCGACHEEVHWFVDGGMKLEEATAYVLDRYRLLSNPEDRP